MSDALKSLCDDVASFRKQVLGLQESDAEKYDKELQVPFWKAVEGKENFSVEVRADVGKFLVHADWLQNPGKSVLSDEENRGSLNDVSKRISTYAQMYLQHFANDKVCEKLIEQLNNLDMVLKNVAKPEGPHGP
jgi:hypothetical protein